MTKPQTTHARDARGAWSSETQFQVNQGVVLKILTMKRFSGALETTAQGHKVEGELLVFQARRDFSMTLASSTGRVTRANVEAQHTSALGQLPSVLAAVEAHYLKLSGVPA